MASFKRMQTTGIPSFFLPISKHGDSAPGLVKSPASLLKRGRHEATDGVVAASVAPALFDVEAAATLGPVIELQVSEENELQGFSSMPPADSFDKRMKVEPVEMAPSAAYLQMPSRDTKLRMLLQCPEHKPILSDKDYAASFCTSVPSAHVSATMRPARSSPQFDEDDETLLELKLLPTKRFAQEFSQDALILPKSFMDLEVMFEQLLKILSAAHARGGKRGTPLESLKDDMLRLYQRTFKKEHLKQIVALVPNCLIVGHAWKDGKFCHRTVSINTANLDLRPGQQVLHAKCLTDMKVCFRQSMLAFLRARHAEFLQSKHPKLKLDPDRINQWHAEFDLGAVKLPASDLPPLPQAQVHDAIHNSIMKDTVVEITPEIEKAFEKHQAETMTLEKMKHIRDCSKSAIGLQNIEKLQKYELNQFALQLSYKAVDKQNAETVFRTAADALRGLFRQRSKVALPLADVLKTLQQSKGLTFKSNLDALNMVDQLVEKLPTFFSRKKFPTHGEMVRFPSSELFPWHQSREYPQ